MFLIQQTHVGISSALKEVSAVMLTSVLHTHIVGLKKID